MDSIVRDIVYEAIEIEWGAMALEVQKDPYGMGQDFADQAMLKMPQIMHAQASNGEALGQMRAHGFYALAPTGTELKQLGTVGRGHPFTWSSDDEDAMALGQQVLSEGINKPFVSRDQPDKASDQVVQQLDVMRASGQEGSRR